MWFLVLQTRLRYEDDDHYDDATMHFCLHANFAYPRRLDERRLYRRKGTRLWVIEHPSYDDCFRNWFDTPLDGRQRHLDR